MTSTEPWYGIMGREKGKGRYKPLDYGGGQLVGNVIQQTLWPDKELVEGIIKELNSKYKKYEFKLVERR